MLVAATAACSLGASLFANDAIADEKLSLAEAFRVHRGDQRAALGRVIRKIMALPKSERERFSRNGQDSGAAGPTLSNDEINGGAILAGHLMAQLSDPMAQGFAGEERPDLTVAGALMAWAGAQPRAAEDRDLSGFITKDGIAVDFTPSPNGGIQAELYIAETDQEVVFDNPPSQQDFDKTLAVLATLSAGDRAFVERSKETTRQHRAEVASYRQNLTPTPGRRTGSEPRAPQNDPVKLQAPPTGPVSAPGVPQTDADGCPTSTSLPASAKRTTKTVKIYRDSYNRLALTFSPTGGVVEGQVEGKLSGRLLPSAAIFGTNLPERIVIGFTARLEDGRFSGGDGGEITGTLVNTRFTPEEHDDYLFAGLQKKTAFRGIVRAHGRLEIYTRLFDHEIHTATLCFEPFVDPGQVSSASDAGRNDCQAFNSDEYDACMRRLYGDDFPTGGKN